MQTFYDQIFSSPKETTEDWKLQLTQVELADLGVALEVTRAWLQW